MIRVLSPLGVPLRGDRGRAGESPGPNRMIADEDSTPLVPDVVTLHQRSARSTLRDAAASLDLAGDQWPRQSVAEELHGTAAPSPRSESNQRAPHPASNSWSSRINRSHGVRHQPELDRGTSAMSCSG